MAAFITWREPRRVLKYLTVQYDKVLYLIEDNELNRRAIGKYIEVCNTLVVEKNSVLTEGCFPYSTLRNRLECYRG